MPAAKKPQAPSRLPAPVQAEPTPALESESSEQEANDLVLAATQIFDHGGTQFPSSLGKTIVIQPAKIKQVGDIMKFFADVTKALKGSDLIRIIDVVASKQHHLAAAGMNPRNLDLKAILAEDGAEMGLDNVTLISLLFQSVFEHLPKFVASFTNLTPDEFDKLDTDEGMLTVFGIFAVNYDFFIQRVLPLLAGFIQSMAREKGKRDQIVASQKKRLPK